MFFNVSVPGFGLIPVETNDPRVAIVAVQQFLNRNRIVLEEGTSVGAAVPVTRDQVVGDLVLDASGLPITLEEFVAPETEENAGNADGGTAPEGASTRAGGGEGASAQQSAANVPSFVGKIIDQNGSVRFVRIDSADTSQARAALESQFGSGSRVEIVSTPQFLLENDTDFASFLQQSGQPDLTAFLQTLQLVVPQEPVTDTGEDDEIGPRPEPELPFDVQAFPFASFQNAVSDLGLDPEGVLGSTVSQRFNALAPAAQIGSLTGTVDAIGQDPGALEQFFRDRFGDLDVAAETFRDLLAGRTSGDLGADQLLSFQSLQNPDIATGRGRGDAADVFRLARAAAEDRFGSFVASRLLPSNTRLFRELERQLAEGDPSTDFLQFARQQNLLPA